MAIESSTTSKRPHAGAKRGPKGLCAGGGVCTTAGIVPVAVYEAQLAAQALVGRRALPVLAAKVGMTTPMPVPMGGRFTPPYKAADLTGPCDWCCCGGGGDDDQVGVPRFHVLRSSGRGCMPVAHGVYCSAACALTALFRHPAYRHWDDADRFAAYQTMQRDPRQPHAYACALFHDSAYQAGRRTTSEVRQSKYRILRASDPAPSVAAAAAAVQPAAATAAAATPRDFFADFFGMSTDQLAALAVAPTD